MSDEDDKGTEEDVCMDDWAVHVEDTCPICGSLLVLSLAGHKQYDKVCLRDEYRVFAHEEEIPRLIKPRKKKRQ